MAVFQFSFSTCCGRGLLGIHSSKYFHQYCQQRLTRVSQYFSCCGYGLDLSLEFIDFICNVATSKVRAVEVKEHGSEVTNQSLKVTQLVVNTVKDMHRLSFCLMLVKDKHSSCLSGGFHMLPLCVGIYI